MIDLARISRDVETTDRWEAEGITEPLTRAEIDRRELLAEALKHRWQPIETAPQDGTPILACAADRPYVPVTAYWAAYHPNAKGKETWRTSEIGGNKLEGLTHWMPLPEPPK